MWDGVGDGMGVGVVVGAGVGKGIAVGSDVGVALDEGGGVSTGCWAQPIVIRRIKKMPNNSLRVIILFLNIPEDWLPLSNILNSYWLDVNLA